jgi:hypothetical protein
MSLALLILFTLVAGALSLIYHWLDIATPRVSFRVICIVNFIIFLAGLMALAAIFLESKHYIVYHW